MTPKEMHARLELAVTEYDRRQSKRKGYNPYALGQYLSAVNDIGALLAIDAEPRKAILSRMKGRLADHCLKALSLPLQTAEELRY